MSNHTSDAPEGFKMTELGPLPEDWNVAPISDVAFVTSGGSAPQGDRYFGGSNPFIRVQHIEQGTHRVTGWDLITDEAVQDCGLRLYREGTIVLPKSGASIYLEKRAVLPLDAYIVSHLCALTPNSRTVDSVFLFHAIRNIRFAELKADGYPTLNLSEIKVRVLPLPPLPEQRAISGVLTTIQQAIEAQDKVIAAARELKKSLMKHLFTYGPVPVADAEKVALKETEIGPAPKHWEVVRLVDMTSEEIRNGAFVRRDRFGSGVPFLNVADTYGDISIDLRSSERVEATRNELDLYAIEPNDLFYVRSSLKRGGVGQCCIVENVAERSIYDCHLMRVRVDIDRVVPKYLACYSVSSPGRQSLISRSKTTTMTTINQQGLSGFILPLPSYSIQKEIADILASIDTKLKIEEERKASLQSLFKTMLHQLMTGRLRAKDMGVTTE